MNDGNVYFTKDLYEASLLIACKIKLLKLVKENNYYLFAFENKAKAEELSAKFWLREIDVDAKAYAEAIRSLKDRIFARRE